MSLAPRRMIPLPFLAHAGQEARHVDERQDRDAERVAGPDEPGRLLRGVDVQAAGVVHRLVGHHADGRALHPAEAGHHVRRETGVHLEELAVVEHVGDHLVHVVGLVRRVGDDRVEFFVLLIWLAQFRVGGLPPGRLVQVVGGQVGQQVAGEIDAILLVLGLVVRDAGLDVVRVRAAELLEGHVLAGHRLDHVGTCDEHVAGALHHEGEIGDRGRVDRAARARTHDERDLRDDAGGHHVAVEDLGEQAERHHPFLDPGAAAVVEPDIGQPVFSA